MVSIGFMLLLVSPKGAAERNKNLFVGSFMLLLKGSPNGGAAFLF